QKAALQPASLLKSYESWKNIINSNTGDITRSALQLRLGIAYEKGLGFEKNIELAMDWFSKALSLGCNEAQVRLEALRGLPVPEPSFLPAFNRTVAQTNSFNLEVSETEQTEKPPKSPVCLND